MKFLLLICSFCLIGLAQPSSTADAVPANVALVPTATIPTGPVLYQPSYFVAAGGEYTKGDANPLNSGWVSFAAKIADSTYSYSTIDMHTTASALRTGFARVLTQSDNFTLLALGDAGLSAGSTISLGSFSAGGVLMYDIGPRFHTQHLYLTGIVRVLKNSSQDVMPVFEFGIGKAF